MKIEQKLPGVKKNILLKNFTTFKIGGRAKYFFVAKNKEDLVKAVLVAKRANLPFFVLGGGSNLLVSDKGYKGLVIKVQSVKYKVQSSNSKCKIFCEAGVPLNKLVGILATKGLTGLEWAAGIPGTVGGAVYGNAGAFGKSMADSVKNVIALKLPEVRPRVIKVKDCKFGYKQSIFKKNKKLIILETEIELKKGAKKEIKKRMEEFLGYRKRTQPLNFPSAGSVFKNPPHFFAGELIEKYGLKGKKIGNVKISEKHANFIVNLGGGKAKDVKKLIKLAKKTVKNNFKVVLEEEIQYLGT